MGRDLGMQAMRPSRVSVPRAFASRRIVATAGLVLFAVSLAGCFGSAGDIVIVRSNSAPLAQSNPTVGGPVASPPGATPTTASSPPRTTTTTAAAPPRTTTTTAAATPPTTTTTQAAPPVGGSNGPANWDLAANRPTGSWITITDNPWQSLSAPGWGVATNRDGPPPLIGQDSSAPDGDASVLVQRYGGTPDGYEPQFPYVGWNGSDELFATTVVKFAPTWVQPSNSGIKWLIVEAAPRGMIGWVGLGASSIPGVPRSGWTSYGFSASGPAIRPNDNYADLPALQGVPMALGAWHKIQWHAQISSDRVRVWIDDILVADSTVSGGMTWASNVGAFNYLQLGATWGGGIGYTAPAGNTLYHARTILWQR